MGQIINPTAFRLGVNISWQINYISDISNNNVILFINNYINNIYLAFGIVTSKPKIEIKKENINISIKIYEIKKEKNTLIYVTELLKNIINKKLNKKINITVIQTSNFTSDAKILGDIIAINFNTKPLRLILKNINK
jgi:hypothetical protein